MVSKMYKNYIKAKMQCKDRLLFLNSLIRKDILFILREIYENFFSLQII